MLSCPRYGPPPGPGGIRPPAHHGGACRAPAPPGNAVPAPRSGGVPAGARGVQDGRGPVATGERRSGIGDGVEGVVEVEKEGAGGEGMKCNLTGLRKVSRWSNSYPHLPVHNPPRHHSPLVPVAPPFHKDR